MKKIILLSVSIFSMKAIDNSLLIQQLINQVGKEKIKNILLSPEAGARCNCAWVSRRVDNKREYLQKYFSGAELDKIGNDNLTVFASRLLELIDLQKGKDIHDVEALLNRAEKKSIVFLIKIIIYVIPKKSYNFFINFCS